MPGRDRTGPRGDGPRSGWGLGLCRPARKESAEAPDAKASDEEDPSSETGPGWGPGRGRGGGRGMGMGPGMAWRHGQRGGRGRGRGRGRGDGPR
jgi:hypothetical protein